MPPHNHNSLILLNPYLRSRDRSEKNTLHVISTLTRKKSHTQWTPHAGTNRQAERAVLVAVGNETPKPHRDSGRMA